MNAGSSQPISESHVRPFDVLLGRGKTTYIHPGNELFRKEVKARSEDYHYQGVLEKDATARALISVVEGKKGRFLRPAQDGSHWIACSQETVRSKTKQALRDDVRIRGRKKKGARGVGTQVRESLAPESAVTTTTKAFQDAARTQALAELSTIRDIYWNDLGNSREGRLHIQSPGQAFQNGNDESLAVNFIEQWNQSRAAQFRRPMASIPSSSFVPLMGCLGQELPPCPPKPHQHNLAPTRSIYSMAPGLAMLDVSQPQPTSLEPLPFFKMADVESDQLDSPTDTRNRATLTDG